MFERNSVIMDIQYICMKNNFASSIKEVYNLILMKREMKRNIFFSPQQLFVLL